MVVVTDAVRMKVFIQTNIWHARTIMKLKRRSSCKLHIYIHFHTCQLCKAEPSAILL